jgi:hypothetical protein
MKKQNRVRANRKPVLPVFQLRFGPVVTDAISKLAKAFPCRHVDGIPVSNLEQQGNAAACLIELGLAHIDAFVPRFVAMIKYCEAEGLNQNDYLNALTEAKFKKKLHLVRRRD